MCEITNQDNGKSQAFSFRKISLALSLILAAAIPISSPAAEPSRSTNIAITNDDTQLINVNQDSNSITVFQIIPTGLKKLVEIPVGYEPHCVAIKPDDSEAYITTADGFVAVVALTGADKFKVTKRIAVGTEPRGCAVTPSGGVLYVANHTSGTVSIINTTTKAVVFTATGFNRPYAIAISNNGDAVDTGETIFVSDFLAEAIPNGPGEPFDNGKRGVIRAFPFGLAGGFVKKIFLSPLADSGFTADRTNFCPQTAPGSLHSNVYCPSLNAAAGSPAIIQDKQGAFPNQLHALLIRGNKMYVPSIGAAPEPPVKFNVNVQALVHVVNATTNVEIKPEHVNLNAQIKNEVAPADPFNSLGKLFGNDIVAIDANSAGNQFVLVSRGGNYVLRAGLVAGKLNIGAPNVVRLQTGHIPTGIVMNSAGNRAYTNNEVGRSVSVLNLANNTVLARDVESSALPVVGSFDHNLLMGKLTFFTALGVPDNGLSALPIRSINPLKFRGKQSDNAWSTCASCHPAGLADGVTWIFADGPRQTVPLDSTYSKRSFAHDQRILNWSAVRGSNTDFNNNSRGVQGGVGFASEAPFSAAAPNPNIFNHGITQGASEALDLETLWIQSVRPFVLPQTAPAGVITAGRKVFEDNCASCHGGAKWTKSQILYRDNPALQAGVPRDPGVTLAASGGGQIQSYTVDSKTLTYLEDVDTFQGVANPIEIKAGGATAFGGDGFNVPSLLGLRYHAPYLHNGSAGTLTNVFAVHKLFGGTIASQLTNTQEANLKDFLNSIDGRTVPFRSEADDFRDPF